MADRLGIRKATGNSANRGNTSMCQLIMETSDSLPGQFMCVECKRPINIQESFRQPPADPRFPSGSLATLFCPECAYRLREAGLLDLVPTNLQPTELLNLGIPLT